MATAAHRARHFGHYLAHAFEKLHHHHHKSDHSTSDEHSDSVRKNNLFCTIEHKMTSLWIYKMDNFRHTIRIDAVIDCKNQFLAIL